MSAHSPSRPLLQFSLQSLLVVTALVAIGVAYRAGHVDIKVIAHYCFLIFAVGPWFAYLAAECLPIVAPQLRTAVANMILLVLFIITLMMAEAAKLPGPVAIVAAAAAVILWTPQYMIFFVWRMAEE